MAEYRYKFSAVYGTYTKNKNVFLWKGKIIFTIAGLLIAVGSYISHRYDQ